MKKIITLIIAIHSLLLTAHLSEAQDTIYVPQNYPTIQQGIDAAMDGNIVLVDTGTYMENINFNGKAITVASHYIMDGDTNHINNTVIDGSQPDNPDDGSVVTFNTGEDTTSVICGFTITHGTGTYLASMSTRMGGGIMCNFAGARIIHNKILNNICDYSIKAAGGGIGCRLSGSWVVIRNNTIRDNVASSNNNALGGGIYSINDSIVISNNIICHDSLSGNYAYGGGVYLSNSDYTEITGNSITRNILNKIEVGSGAGVFCNFPLGPLNVFQNEFSYNIGGKTGYNSGSGGGLFIWNAYDYPVEVDGNRFLYNSVWFGGGFYEKNSYNLKLTNNVFIGNDTDEGGAIGIWHANGDKNYRPQFINNTFLRNSASENGGAMTYYGDFNGSSPVIMNCIFRENSAWMANDIRNWSGDTLFVYYSDIDTDDISGSWTGESNIYVDPEFIDDSYHLDWPSQCVNAGIDSLEVDGVWYYSPVTDIDTEARPFEWTDTDIGADEAQWHYVGREETEVPDIKSIIWNYPNPFSISTTIEYELQRPSTVQITIYNQLGKQVSVITNKRQQKGKHKLAWRTKNLPSGIYYCVLKTDNGKQTKKLIKME